MDNDFKEILKEKGLKVTNQRVLVLETVASHPGEHLTAEEIFDLVRIQYPDIGLATIYRTVQVLVDLDILDKVSFDDGISRYELGIGGNCDKKHHHHHAICTKCGKVFSFKEDLLDTLEQTLMEVMDFTVTDHEVKLYGCCSECKKSENNIN